MDIDELIKKHLKDMSKTACPKRTICEVLREILEINSLVSDEDLRAELRARIFVAYDMAKRMNRKLREYKHNWDEKFWEDNIDVAKDMARRAHAKNKIGRPCGNDR